MLIRFWKTSIDKLLELIILGNTINIGYPGGLKEYIIGSMFSWIGPL